MNTPDRSLLAPVIVILALTFFGVLVSVYPIAPFITQSVDKPIIPVWEPADEDQTAKQTADDDTPTPTLSSSLTHSETSEATEETAIDPTTSEVVEAALREPFVEEPKTPDKVSKGDDLPRATFNNPAGHLTDPALPKVESPPPLENTITPSEDPVLASTDQYPGVMAQPVPSQTPPPDSPTGTEASLQPPLDLQADMDPSWQLPPELSADTEAFPQP
jgi:hypothetical protein